MGPNASVSVLVEAGIFAVLLNDRIGIEGAVADIEVVLRVD